MPQNPSKSKSDKIADGNDINLQQLDHLQCVPNMPSS
jgi:hypothetical protein